MNNFDYSKPFEIKLELEELSIKVEPNEIAEDGSLKIISYDINPPLSVEKNVDNHDDVDVEEGLIKDEPEEVSQDNSSLDIKYNANFLTVYLKDHIENNELKADPSTSRIEDLDNICTYNNDHVVTSKVDNSLHPKLQNRAQENNSQESSISDLDQGTFKFTPPSSSKMRMQCHKNDQCGTCLVPKVYKENPTAKKPFKCPNCQKCFSEKGYLKQHMVVHDGIKCFECEQCDSSFIRNGDLKKHMLIHEGKKLFKCQQCDTSFLRNGDLNKHMMKHEGKKPFKCQQCGKCFTHNFNLKLHMLCHENKKPFKCQHCDKYFKLKGNLKRHISMCHQNKKFFK